MFTFQDTNDKDRLGDSYLDFLIYKNQIASLLRWTTSRHQIPHLFSFWETNDGGQSSEWSLFPISFLHAFSYVLTTYSFEQLATNASQAIEPSSTECDEPYK